MNNISRKFENQTLGEIMETPEGREEFAGEIYKMIEPHVPAIKKTFEEFSQLVSHAVPYIQTLVENLKAFPSFAKKMSGEFHKRSWYIIPQALPNEVFEIARLLEADDLTGIDNLMVRMVTKNLREIENDICRLYPLREPLIREAFQNHHDGRYASAILMLFSQTDGITAELLHTSFFSKDNGVPKTAGEIQSIIGVNRIGDDEAVKYERDLAYSLLEPMLVTGAVNANSDGITPIYPDGINRHTALHGIVTNYGTEMNSLKVISLISYLTGIAVSTIEDSRP